MAMTPMLRVFLVSAWLISITIASRVAAQTAYPMVMSIAPVAAQVGTTSEHTVRSRYAMDGAFQVIVSGGNVQGKVVPAKEKASNTSKPPTLTNDTLTIELTVDAHATPGVRDLRIVTPRGVSTVGQVVLVADPVVSESVDNNQAQAAQAVQEIATPSVVCGQIEKAEDVDFYQFHTEAGATLCFHVMCMRLQNRVHDLQQHADPILTLRDANGSVVAASDNHLSGDPLVCHTFARGGDYTLEIRDVRFQGNIYWEYSIEINARPFVTTVYPLGVAHKGTTKLQLLGESVGNAGAEFTPDAATELGLHTRPISVGPSNVHPQPLFVTEDSLADESTSANETVATAQSITLPCGINGRIEREADVDCFSFDAKKGERYTFEVIAHRAGSSLDSHLRILDEKGNQLQLSDDMKLGRRSFPDSWVEDWTVPADGKYTLEIRDLHLRGGESFVYFIKSTRSAPYFNLFTDTDKTPIAPGTTGVVFVRAEKKSGFDEEIQLAVEGLPAGVTAHCGRILKGKNQDGCIVFEVADNVQPSAADIVITGTSSIDVSEGGSSELTAKANVYQEIYQPGGGRGHWPVDSHVLAITAPSDIRKVRVDASELKIKAGESAAIEVEIERAAGFDKNVTLEITYSHLNTVFGNSLPEGVTLDAGASNTLLTAGSTKGKIVLKAAPTAQPVEKQQAVVMANVSLNFVVKATYASSPIMITVVK